MICLLSYYDENYASLGQISRRTIEKYAQRFGYESIVHTKKVEYKRPPSWQKIKLIEDAFEKGYEYVFWIDADALFVDYSKDIQEEIEPTKYLYLVAHPTGTKLVPNLGTFLIKNCIWSKKLLQKMWESEEYIHHKWWENAALINILGINSLLAANKPDTINGLYLQHIKWLSLAWNNLPLYAPMSNPIINHYSAVSYAERLAHMKKNGILQNI